MTETRGARLGVVECMSHELLHEYPVLYEKPGDAVAHFKATVLVMKNGNDRITTWTSPAHAERPRAHRRGPQGAHRQPLKSKKKKRRSERRTRAA